MEIMKRARPESSDTRSVQLTELLERACRQPGVNDLMAVYRQWEPLERMIQQYRDVTAVKRIIVTSNTSGPTIDKTMWDVGKKTPVGL